MIQDLLAEAIQAEEHERYAEARETYQKVLDLEVKTQTLRPEHLLSVKHSIAFCRLMDHQYEQAAQLLAALLPDDTRHGSSAINQTAAEIAVCIEDTPAAPKIIRPLSLRVKYEMEIIGKTADLYHVSAVLSALIAKLEDGRNREMEFRLVKLFTQLAISRGLSKRKALAIGHLLPEADQFEPLRSIKQNDPRLAPDLEVNLPVRSPATGQDHTLRVMLP